MGSEEPRSKPVRFTNPDHELLNNRRYGLERERGTTISLPAYIKEASEFFEKNRIKAASEVKK